MTTPSEKDTQSATVWWEDNIGPKWLWGSIDYVDVRSLAQLIADTKAEAVAEGMERAAGMRRALESAANQFRYYEKMHRYKGTSDGDEKAITNANMATLCEAAIRAATDKPMHTTGDDT